MYRVHRRASHIHTSCTLRRKCAPVRPVTISQNLVISVRRGEILDGECFQQQKANASPRLGKRGLLQGCDVSTLVSLLLYSCGLWLLGDFLLNGTSTQVDVFVDECTPQIFLQTYFRLSPQRSSNQDYRPKMRSNRTTVSNSN